jgi:hypothetical protein
MKFIKFIIKLFSFQTPIGDAESAKNGRLRQITKEISRNRFARFYKPKTGEITGEMGGLFYDIYRVIAPAQLLLSNAVKSAVLKQTIVEYFIGKDAKEIEKMLDWSPEERAKKGGVLTIFQTASKKLTSFSAAFNVVTIHTIDRCYSDFLSLIKFISFDYLGVLKEFNQKIREYDFSHTPAFGNVCGQRLTDRIKDFLQVAFEVDSVQNWERIIKILKQYRNNIMVINHGQWNRILNRLYEIRRSGILEKIVRHIDENPSWQSKQMITNQHIAVQYLENKQAEVRTWLDTVIRSQKNAQKKSMLINVFGNDNIQRTWFYTDRANEIYIKKGFEGFLHTETLNYLLTFLTDEFNSKTNDLYNMLISRGEWVMQESCKEMSMNYHQLTELASKITAFDCGFSDGGSYGYRLRKFILETASNNTESPYIDSILANANEEALALINTGIDLITDIGKKLNALLNDSRNSRPAFIGNWKKLDKRTGNIVKRITESCERINNFALLMHFLTEGESTDVQAAA